MVDTGKQLRGRAAVFATGPASIPVIAFGLSLSVTFVITYALCVVFYLLFPFAGSSHAVLTLFLPWFKLLSWQSFLLGLVESFVLGWYVALIFAPLFNVFARRFGGNSSDMKSINLHVEQLLSVLSARGVEKQLARLPGVVRAEVNGVSGSTTIVYDDSKIDLPAIKARIDQCGHHCGGELVPRHVCEPEDPPAAAAAAAAVHDHAIPAVKTKTEKPAHAAHADGMAHEMGHGAGMDMQSMARDMRNRFWIALVFSVPIFLYAPMGMDFIKLEPPFGLRLNVLLFVLASGAILYPVWPFMVAAYRALRNGVLNMAVLVILSVGTEAFYSNQVFTRKAGQNQPT